MRMSSLSTEYLRYKVTATVAGQDINPTGDTVQFTFTQSNTPPSSGWATGSWETYPDGNYVAKILIGPAGSQDLAAGSWIPWIKITDNPEIPVRQLPAITILP